MEYALRTLFDIERTKSAYMNFEELAGTPFTNIV